MPLRPRYINHIKSWYFFYNSYGKVNIQTRFHNYWQILHPDYSAWFSLEQAFTFLHICRENLSRIIEFFVFYYANVQFISQISWERLYSSGFIWGTVWFCHLHKEKWRSLSSSSLGFPPCSLFAVSQLLINVCLFLNRTISFSSNMSCLKKHFFDHPCIQ